MGPKSVIITFTLVMLCVSVTQCLSLSLKLGFGPISIKQNVCMNLTHEIIRTLANSEA